MENDDDDIDYLEEMEKDERVQREARDLIAKFRANEKKLTAEGIDVPAQIARIEKHLGRFQEAVRNVDVSLDKELHAAADLAVLRIPLYKELRIIADIMKEEDPFNPRLEELEDTLDALRQQLPKDLEE